MVPVRGLCIEILEVSLNKVFPFRNFTDQIGAIPCTDGLDINNNLDYQARFL